MTCGKKVSLCSDSCFARNMSVNFACQVKRFDALPGEGVATMPHELNRRSFVGAAASVAGAAALAPLLSACGGGGQQHTGTNTKAGLKAALPAYVPRTPVKPDIAPVAGSDGAVTDPGFLHYPSEQVATVSGAHRERAAVTAPSPRCGAPCRPPATPSTRR